MHFDVPDVNNAVGVNFRTVLVNSGLASISVLPAGDGTEGTISAAEVTLLSTGAVFEHVTLLNLSGPGATAASRVALLQERYTAINAEIIARVQAQLNFFGFNQARA